MATYTDLFVGIDEKPASFGQKYPTLSLEIWNKFQASQQSLSMFQDKLRMQEAIAARLKNTNYTVEIQGSTLSGIGISTSDLDLSLLINGKGSSTSGSKHEAIRILRSEILPVLNGIGSSHKSVVAANTPILKFTSNNGFEVDISIGKDLNGLKKTYLLLSFVLFDSRVRPLIAIVKLWASRNQINDPQSNTLSGYALTLLVVHYLQTMGILPTPGNLYGSSVMDLKNQMKELIHRKQRLMRRVADPSLGELFIGFLKYYSEFEFATYGISILTGRKEGKYSMTTSPSWEWKHICIQDPVDRTNVSRSVHIESRFLLIKQAFKNSYERLFNQQRLSSVLV